MCREHPGAARPVLPSAAPAHAEWGRERTQLRRSLARRACRYRGAAKKPGPRGPRRRETTAAGGGMARALTVRIGLSVLLFLCILIAWKLGYIQPSGLPVGK